MGFSGQNDQCLNGSLSTWYWVNRLAIYYLLDPEYNDRDVLPHVWMDNFHKHKENSTATITFFTCIWKLTQFISKRRIDSTPHINSVISIVLLLGVVHLVDVTLNGLLWCEVWINRVTFYFTETCCYIFHKLFVCFLLILILTLFLLCFCTVICFISISLTYFILFYPLFLLSQSRINCVSQFLLL